MTTQSTSTPTGSAEPAGAPRLPWLALIVLASAVFVAIVSELLPAGLLTPMADDLGVSESGAGLLVTVYALATGAAAIPLIAATRSVPRRRLLATTVIGFAATNLLTAAVSDYAVMMVVRVLGGVCTGVIWSMVAGYAAAMVPEYQRGRALAVALGGASVGYAVGLPASAALGALVGWRAAFLALGLIGVAGYVLVLAVLPKIGGETRADREPFFRVLRRPGVWSVAAVTATVVLGHQTLYTYIDPFLQRAGVPGAVSGALLLFGVGSVVGVATSGRFIDRNLRATLLAVLLWISTMFALLGLFGALPAVAIGVPLLWGLAYGALTPIMQTAAVRAGGPAADVSVSVTVTAWSIGIAAGAALGGVAFDARGAGVLPWLACTLTLAGAAAVVVARRGFPPPARRTAG